MTSAQRQARYRAKRDERLGIAQKKIRKLKGGCRSSGARRGCSVPSERALSSR
jgi:hypothetical protein